MSLATVRRAYADTVTADLTVERARIAAAFARVPREHFLGPGPWQMLGIGGYEPTDGDDPALVYVPRGIALDPTRGINNGEPQLHARMMAAAAPQPGHRVLQAGTGSGYYTAILADLVGDTGHVYGYEIDASLARWARTALTAWPTVEVRQASASEGPLPQADVLYVCAGASRPGDAWLGALAPGGRLVFPLTPDARMGGILRIGAPDDGGTGVYEARFVSLAAFIACQGLRHGDDGARLTETFARGDMEAVRSLRRDTPPDGSCWFAWDDRLWLSTRPLGA